MQAVSIKVNGTKIHEAINASPFTFSQVTKYLGVGPGYFNNVKSRNVIEKIKFANLCGLLGCKATDFAPPVETPKPAPEPPKAKPMTAREDHTQDWMVNIYRAIEDMNDRYDQVLKRLDILIAQNNDLTAAIRGLKGGES